MLIKYRCGIVSSARNKTFRSRTGAVIGRSTIHMRSSFTIKRSVPTWRPTIRVYRTAEVASVTTENNVVTLAHSDLVHRDSILGKI